LASAYHCELKTISRSAGRSATAAIAYRSGECVVDLRTGLVFDYGRRSGIESTEIFLPSNTPAWAANRSELWNAAERAETRKNSTVAREFVVAIPADLDADSRRELVRQFARSLVERHGVAVDIAIHAPDRQGSQRNHHAHILFSTRRLEVDGFGKKTRELDAQSSGPAETVRWKEEWAERSANELKRAGFVMEAERWRHGHLILAKQVERAHERGDVEFVAENESSKPTVHMGVNVVQMERRGVATERGEQNREIEQTNAKVIDLAAVRRELEIKEMRLALLERPVLALEVLARSQSTFRERDIDRELRKYLSEAESADARARIDQSPTLVNLTPARAADAVFSTRDVIATEIALAENAEQMARVSRHVVSQQKALSVLDSEPFQMLSAEQRAAVLHLTTGADIAAVTGAAGAGKSTALAAAREIWEAKGYRVRGAALAGKAADGLQEGAGIESRTLHSLEFALAQKTDSLTARDVLVIDEAGMVGSQQLGRVLKQARDAGAKVVLVGDAEQLQPIEAGAAFRAVCERVGVVEISTIRRQREDWAKAASQAFAKGDTAAGLDAYAERGAIRLEENREAARAALVGDWMADQSGGSRIVLAHTNADVKALNEAIRDARREAGALGTEAQFATAKGDRGFAPGDRVVFLKNDRALGVKNGMLGTVERAESGQLTVSLDNGESRAVDQATYNAVDHGYAVTVHKAQGVTVDRAFVLATGGMDRHLTYVGMTRHRDAATLYAGREEFGDAGGLAQRLGKARPKETVLDFIERRDIGDTPRSWIENGRAMAGRLAERFAVAVDQLRERLGPETLRGTEHERDSGRRTDRTADASLGRAAGRAADQQPGRATAGRKSNLGRVGQLPPPAARGRLRTLSELGVVRFPERGEVLLPGDVPRDMEHQRAEPDNALRRRDDGLTAAPAGTREAVQRTVNAEQLRDLVKQRDPLPREASNDPNPDAVKADWQAEKGKQFVGVASKARRVEARAAGQIVRQEGKLASHDKQRPQEPAGLFAGMKKASHAQAMEAWRGERVGLEKRFNQLRNRLHLVDGYTRKADGPYELATPGERLAELKASQARPELAASFRKLTEREKAAAIAQQRAKIEQRQHGKKERTTMKQESIEELKQRTDANREKADKAERAELEKAGRLASMQNETLADAQGKDTLSTAAGRDGVADAGKKDALQADKSEQTAEQAKEARRREMLERFKDKAAKDRGNDKGHGR
jgi:Ti-type conjugative transfer relaxase TraA